MMQKPTRCCLARIWGSKNVFWAWREQMALECVRELINRFGIEGCGSTSADVQGLELVALKQDSEILDMT